MSYSFHIRAASKALAATAVAAELDKVVESQPIHSADRKGAEDAFSAFLELISEPSEGEEVSVSMNGSVGKRWVDGQAVGDPTNVSVGVNVSIVPKAE